MLASCHSSGQRPALYESGVSQELAIARKQIIRDLKYDLFFSIPQEKAQPVTGEVTLSFRLDKPEEIILDFREPADKISAVAVNGKPSGYVFRNEHIIVPAGEVVAGENTVTVRFTAGDQSLNRNGAFLYTLLVP